jgi:hypothetical protein
VGASLLAIAARSSCRACEAAFGCEAVVEAGSALFQAIRVRRICEDFVLERSLAGSAAATEVDVFRYPQVFAKNVENNILNLLKRDIKPLQMAVFPQF